VTAASDGDADDIVWDNHACMPLDPACEAMAELAQVRAAGVNVVSLNVASGEQRAGDAVQMLAAFRRWIGDHSDEFMLVASAAEARAARASGKLGICFDIEGMTVLEDNPELVTLYSDLGVRWMLPVYNRANSLGGGCLDATDSGLTVLGRRMVEEMNRAGVVVCASHAGYRTAHDLIEASAAPVIFSHSNPRALWDTPRNIPDELMLACARRGGVVGINGIGAFLGPNDARTATYVTHVEYALDLIGEDHVGIALDYCFGVDGGMEEFMVSYPELFPAGHGYERDGMQMVAPWKLPEIVASLRARGRGTATLAKLLGGNHLRIADTVWQKGL
jgi:membrane dipeptidase